MALSEAALEVTMLNTFMAASLRVGYYRPSTSQYCMLVFTPFDYILNRKSLLILSEGALQTQSVYSIPQAAQNKSQ
jgi:hypothetical protein